MKSFWIDTTIVIWGGIGVFCGWQTYQGNPRFYSTFVMPHIQYFVEPEKSHQLAIKFMSMGLVPKSKFDNEAVLKSSVFEKSFKNPVGIAAGFDKHAEAMHGLQKVGFGYIEVGSVTPIPQVGNKKPRVFRLAEDYAVINRYGFNSCGHELVARSLKKYRRKGESNIVLGVNLGKNKTSQNAVEDYVKGIATLGPYADYMVINVSSPNTPGLRKLQAGDSLEIICNSVIKARNKLENKPALLVKIAPDLNEAEKKEIARVILKTKIDGIIVSNTTVQRPDSLRSKSKDETGGLSGEPLRIPSTQLIAEMYRYTEGKIPIIGVGGIKNGMDAYEKIRAGASLVQIYTSFIYEGPPIVDSINKQLTFLLQNDNFSNVSEAVGAAHR